MIELVLRLVGEDCGRFICGRLCLFVVEKEEEEPSAVCGLLLGSKLGLACLKRVNVDGVEGLPYLCLLALFLPLFSALFVFKILSLFLILIF